MTAPRMPVTPGAREGGHFRVRLVSAAFRGRSQLERHRLVYAAVAPLLRGECMP